MINRKATEKLLVARDFCCSKANTDDGARYKSVVRGTTREHVKQNVKMCGGFAVDENIVEYSAFGLTGVQPNDDEGEGGIILKAPTKFCDKGVRS